MPANRYYYCSTRGRQVRRRRPVILFNFHAGPPQHGAVVLVLFRENTSAKTDLMHETTCDKCVSTSNGEIR